MLLESRAISQDHSDLKWYATHHHPKMYPYSKGVRALRGYFGPSRANN